MSSRQRISSPPSVHPVTEVLLYFFRLGCLGFGGPLALVATMQKDLVEKRGWMESEAFARAFALIKAMPGPIAFQTAVFLGRKRAGWRGGIAAAFGVVFPPFVMMVLFGVFYSQFHGVSAVEDFMTGMQAAALGVILAGLKGLFWPHRLKPIFWVLASIAAVLTFLSPANEPLLIIGSGLLTVLLFQLRNRSSWRVFRHIKLSMPPLFLQSAGLSWHQQLIATSPVIAQDAWWAGFSDLVWSCFKAGAFVFGSGLAIVPMMEHDFVQRLGWLTHKEFLDALAFGQVTPGPVVITATFIGFKTFGLIGAIAGTLAIFGASFIHMMTWFPPLVDRLTRLPWIAPFLTGAIAAVVGAIAATVARLSMEWVGQPLPYMVAACILVAALFSKLPAWSLIPIGGISVWLMHLVI